MISRLNFSILLTCLCCWMIIAHGQDQPSFSRRVVGYVKDRQERPVIKAKVCAEPHGAWVGPIPCGVSKLGGRFTLNIWRAGIYSISAEKKSDAYPNVHHGFYGSFFGELPTITVDESSELKPVEVIVGPKAGSVIFKIYDESGRLVESGAVKVCRTDDPGMCSSMSTAFPGGNYELLTPEVPFTVRFQVWGSGKWEDRSTFDQAGVPIEVLQIDLGARKKMTIRLRRVP